MEILPQKDDFRDDELLTFLEGFCNLASLTSTCQEIDPSGALPSDCKVGSAQWWAWVFGTFVAMYALHDKEWRENLFSEGEFVIDGKVTRIWVWDDIWGNAGVKGTPDRLIPLVVGSLLSDYDDSRDYKALREHYLCMWSGSYTSYGKPLSEVGPQDDLYWAMRIVFVDKMLEQPKPAEVQGNIGRELATIKDMLTNMSLRHLKEHRQSEEKWDELFARFPKTTESIQLRLKERLGDNVRLVPQRVLDYCVQGEQFYHSGIHRAEAISNFAKATEACLKHYLNPFIARIEQRHINILQICLPPETKKPRSAGDLRRLSLRDWAYILDNRKSRELFEGYFRSTRLPDFHPLAESLRRIQKLRNPSAHDAEPREDSQESLEEMRALVTGVGKQTPVIVLIPQLLKKK